MQKIFVKIALLAVLSAFGILFLWRFLTPDIRPPKPVGHMENLIPLQAGKWTASEVPLGSTPEVERATESILSTSEYLSRKYSTADGREFLLYISYWAQGKETTFRAKTHIPDNCWVGGGWNIVDGTKKSGGELSLNGKEFIPYYERTFSIKQRGITQEEYRRNVRFWFVLEGEPFDFEDSNSSLPRSLQYFKYILEEGYKGIPEQYFIRIDSVEPLEKLFADEDFQVILDSLGKLILYKNDNPQENTSSEN